MASGLSHGTRRDVSIESMARPVAVDHRISIHYYFRIADNLLRQADVYREEKNVLDLYIILLRYSSLLLETIPKHRDYNAFKAREKDFLKKGLHNSEKILGVVNELESLKPVVQQQIATLNSRGADEPNGVYGTHVASSGLEHHTPGPYMSKSMAGSPTLLLQKPLPGSKHQAAPSQSIQPYRHAMKMRWCPTGRANLCCTQIPACGEVRAQSTWEPGIACCFGHLPRMRHRSASRWGADQCIAWLQWCRCATWLDLAARKVVSWMRWLSHILPKKRT